MSQSHKERKRREAELRYHMNELANIRTKLDSAYSVFNGTTEDYLLDAAIFEISALKARYNSEFSKIKELSVGEE